MLCGNSIRIDVNRFVDPRGDRKDNLEVCFTDGDRIDTRSEDGKGV